MSTAISGRHHDGPGLAAVGESVDAALLGTGFEPRQVLPTVIGPNDSDRDERIVAVWLRTRDVPREHGEEAMRRGLDADWASAWTRHVQLRVAGARFDLAWDRTPLDADQLGEVIEQLLSAADRLASPTIWGASGVAP